MLMEQDPDVAVTVRKLVIVSLMELFKDITPSYKIRPLTEAEKSTKVMLDITTTQDKLKTLLWQRQEKGFPDSSVVKNLPTMEEMWVQSLGREDPLEEKMATPSSILVGKPHGQRSLAGYSPQDHKESDMTLATEHAEVGEIVGVLIFCANLKMDFNILI